MKFSKASTFQVSAGKVAVQGADVDCELQSSVTDCTLHVQVIGEIDMATADKLTELVAVTGAHCQEVIIDLARVLFLDSFGFMHSQLWR